MEIQWKLASGFICVNDDLMKKKNLMTEILNYKYMLSIIQKI